MYTTAAASALIHEVVSPVCAWTLSFQCRPLSVSGSNSGVRVDVISYQRSSAGAREFWNCYGRKRHGVVVANSTLPEDHGVVQESSSHGFSKVTETDVDGPIPQTTHLFYDELREATEELMKRALADKSLDSSRLGLNKDEGSSLHSSRASEDEGDGYYIPSEEAEDEGETSSLSGKQYAGKPVLGKIPIESNGPPMVILQQYLLPDDSEKKLEQKLRFLPLPMPHKLRPWGLPKASLRRRLGILPSRKSISKGQVLDFTKDLAVQIQALPVKAHASAVLNKSVWKITKGSLAKTVRELGSMQLTEKVLQVLSWLKKQPHLWPDYTTLGAVIRVLVEAGEIDVAFELQSSLGRDSAKVAQTLAVELAKIGMLGEAAQVLNQMKQSGWRLSGSVHTKFIQWACNIGARDIVNSLLKGTDLLELNLKPQDYTSIMVSCSKLGLVDKVESVYLQFKSSGLQPNIVMYTILISRLSKEGKYREALALFWDMEEAGCIPDIRAYEVMLDVCEKLGDLKRALKVFKGLKEAGFDPTGEIYSILIRLHKKYGLIPTADNLMEEMQSRGYAPSAQTLLCVSRN